MSMRSLTKSKWAWLLLPRFWCLASLFGEFTSTGSHLRKDTWSSLAQRKMITAMTIRVIHNRTFRMCKPSLNRQITRKRMSVRLSIVKIQSHIILALSSKVWCSLLSKIKRILERWKDKKSEKMIKMRVKTRGYLRFLYNLSKSLEITKLFE